MLRRIILGSILLVSALIAYVLFRPYTVNEEPIRIRLSNSVELKELEGILKEEKIVTNGFWLRIFAGIRGLERVPAGSYVIPPGENLYQLVHRFRAGRQTPVKMVLGNERNKLRTISQFASKMQRLGYTRADSATWMAFLSVDDSLKSFGVNQFTALTRLLPLTYEVYWTDSPHKVYGIFNHAWERFWNSTRKAKASKIGLTPTEVIILASIVEEETQHAPDRTLIASTYLNRLRIGMPLQADPTAKYGSGDFAAKRVTFAHLRHPSPYNTYLVTGLPPGPICLPSVAAIDAVLNAPQTEYLYFVASHRFDGTSVFNKEYSQHLKDARLYQEELKKRVKIASKSNP